MSAETVVYVTTIFFLSPDSPPRSSRALFLSPSNLRFSLSPSTSQSSSPPPPPPAALDGAAVAAPGVGNFGGLFKFDRPKLRVTSEYDSESSVFFNKISCKLLDNLAKLKLTFQNGSSGEVSEPQFFLNSKFFSLQYDVEESDASIWAKFFRVRASAFSDLESAASVNCWPTPYLPLALSPA